MALNGKARLHAVQGSYYYAYNSLRVYGGGSARESHPVVFSRTEAFESLCALEALFYLFIIL